MGASQNPEFARMQGAEKISPRRICVICEQENQFQWRVTFRLAKTRFFPQRSSWDEVV